MDERADTKLQGVPMASEVLSLGQIPTPDYKEFINYTTRIEENNQEELCLIYQGANIKSP